MTNFYVDGGKEVSRNTQIFTRPNGSQYTSENGITREVYRSDAERGRLEAAEREKQQNANKRG